LFYATVAPRSSEIRWFDCDPGEPS